MALPSDPFILLSYVNTQLRDKYRSLEEMCSDMDESVSEIKEKLGSAGFEYDEKLNRFF